MQETYELTECEIEEFIPTVNNDIYSLLGIQSEQKNLSGLTDAQMIQELVAMNGTFSVSYMSEIRK